MQTPILECHSPVTSLSHLSQCVGWLASLRPYPSHTYYIEHCIISSCCHSPVTSLSCLSQCVGRLASLRPCPSHTYYIEHCIISSCVHIGQYRFVHYITLNIKKYRAVFTSSSAHLSFTLLHRILNDIELCYHKQRGIYLWER